MNAKYKQFFSLAGRVFPLLLFLGIFFWVIVGSTVLFFLPLASLNCYTGKVEHIKRVTYDCLGTGRYSIASCEKTTIQLDNSGTIFHVADYLNKGADLSGIQEGDSISIYVRHWYQYPLTFGSLNEMYQLEKNGEILLPFKWVKSLQKAKVIVSLPFFIVSLVFLVLELQTIKQLEKKGSNIS